MTTGQNTGAKTYLARTNSPTRDALTKSSMLKPPLLIIKSATTSAFRILINYGKGPLEINYLGKFYIN